MIILLFYFLLILNKLKISDLIFLRIFFLKIKKNLMQLVSNTQIKSNVVHNNIKII